MGCRQEGMETCSLVMLVEMVTVLDGHEMIMLANVRAVTDDITGIIESSPGFVSKHSVLVAQVVAKPRDNQVPLRLLNPSLYPVVLH